tara:strand:+ start:493 stop:729 length:237 start_codon:yes stop_codon:yes gene_type:complete
MSGKGKLVGWTVVLAMWTGMSFGLQYMANNPKENYSEVVNTAEDMIEWIGHDVENGKTDSTIADTYIDNLEQIIKEIR